MFSILELGSDESEVVGERDPLDVAEAWSPLLLGL